jgi:hypothetical protein
MSSLKLLALSKSPMPAKFQSSPTVPTSAVLVMLLPLT